MKLSIKKIFFLILGAVIGAIFGIIYAYILNQYIMKPSLEPIFDKYYVFSGSIFSVAGIYCVNVFLK